MHTSTHSWHFFAGSQWKLSLSEEVALAVGPEDKDGLRLEARLKTKMRSVDMCAALVIEVSIHIWYSYFAVVDGM